MGKVGAFVGVVSLAAVASGCGTNEGADLNAGSTGGTGQESGGSASGGSASGGSASGGSASGGSPQSSGGGDGGAPKECEAVGGQLAYGPIGEPWPILPVSAAFSSTSVGYASGFRTAAGYGFVFFDTNASTGPTLFSLNVDSSFQGGTPRSLAEVTGWGFDLTPTSDGFIAAICTREDKPEWIHLNSDLLVVEKPDLVAPDVPCGSKPPRVVWTGEVYLTSFTDERGLVVASLSAEGDLIGEEILSDQVGRPGVNYFSKNADRVLFVFSQTLPDQGWYVVLDLQGTPLGEAKPFNESESSSWGASVVAKGEGWWVLGDHSASNSAGGLLTEISSDGVVGREGRVLYESVWPGTFVPSVHGGSLLVTDWSEVSLFAHSFSTTALIDDVGKVVYSKQTDFTDTVGSWPVVAMVDPRRDLVIERQELEGSEPMLVVQEYGCLD